MKPQNSKVFRKLVLKAFGILTGNWNFLETRIRVNGNLMLVWDVRTRDLIDYMVEKGGDFRKINSLEDLRQIVRLSNTPKAVPKPKPIRKKQYANSENRRAYA